MSKKTKIEWRGETDLTELHSVNHEDIFNLSISESLAGNSFDSN